MLLTAFDCRHSDRQLPPSIDSSGGLIVAITLFDGQSRHEQVIFCQDSSTGLKAIIAVHSTALGPALGGVRFYPYASEEEAVRDVLRLSEAMTYKNSLAGLDLGGGKSVIIGDPTTQKDERLLEAFGRCVELLGGRYITACDVGTTMEDMDVITRTCSRVVGRSREAGGVGDPSPATAYGVYRGMLACAEHVWGTAPLVGRRVGVSGVGKVGSALIAHLVTAGAEVVVSDVDLQALERAVHANPGVAVAADPEALLESEIDIFAPCALGGVLNEESVWKLGARIVCGAANNQLDNSHIDSILHRRGILYAPDYLVNAAGVIHVAGELDRHSAERTPQTIERIYDTMKNLLELASARGISTGAAAVALAERRMAGTNRRSEAAA